MHNMLPKITIFTICSKNFTAYAKTLFDSVAEHHSDVEKILFLCDRSDPEYEKEKFDFKIIPLEKLQIPEIEEMANRYNITEFNTAIKPFAFKYLFEKLGRQRIVYLDPDILVLSPLEEVFNEFEKGAECILTPHILEPAENLEMTDVRFLQYGIYNLGFVGFQRTANIIKVVNWWARQLIDKCLIDLPRGLFVDQKWADLFPAFITNTSVLHHPGYNVAYWNILQRKIELIGNQWLSNGQPLRFVHFSGHQPGQYNFSRHSSILNKDNIGDLRLIVDLYYEKIQANRHGYYSQFPYAFNWNGASGFNPHTPQEINTDQMFVKKLLLNVMDLLKGIPRKISKGIHLLILSAGITGGWFSLIKKVLGTLKREGVGGLVQRYSKARSYANLSIRLTVKKQDLHLKPSEFENWVPRLLFIDWSTPRPDQDAGSISAFNTLRIFAELGYDVTFIPSDLRYADEYTDALRKLGIQCFSLADIQSVKSHLQLEGGNYRFVVIHRAPIADLHMSVIRKYAPQAQLLLIAADLHYLRESRAAELAGSKKKIIKAARSKEWELDIFRQCDVVIVLSSAEYVILNDEMPGMDIRVIPLVFIDPIFTVPSFESRTDFLFVGGFRHLPNIDAVVYFCQEIFPLVRKQLPDAKFHIVGSNPPSEILALAQIPGVVVHGHIKDISTIFQACKLSIAPLRFGAGIKGKIATSMAYGVPVIATSLAAEGMQINNGEHIVIADTPQQFADSMISVYTSKDIWTNYSEKGREQAYQIFSVPAIKRGVSSMMQDLNPLHKQLEIHVLKSYEEYCLLKGLLVEDIKHRQILELALIKHNQPSFLIDGFCAICGCESQFNTSFMYAYQETEDKKPIPNWREHLTCIQCGFQNRIRAAIHILYQFVKPARNVDMYITEQVTPLFNWLIKQHPRLIGSEYLGTDVPWGAHKDGIRNEDLTQLTFADHSFDYVLSFDVLEQVNDDFLAFKQVYRCLKPGGVFLFSAPFLQNRIEKLVRARLNTDGSIEHLLEPEYHGNPVDHEGGSLCFRYFGWDLIKDLKSVGFGDVSVYNYWSRDFSYLGGEQFLFIATKQAGS